MLSLQCHMQIRYCSCRNADRSTLTRAKSSSDLETKTKHVKAETRLGSLGPIKAGSLAHKNKNNNYLTTLHKVDMTIINGSY